MEQNKNRYRKIATIITALIVCFAMAFVVMPEETYAATKKPAKVVLSSVKSTDYNAIKVTWKKAKNAKKYQVYRATSKNGTYKLVKTTTAKTFTNKKLVTGKKYYYKVRAVNGSKKGTFSTKKYAVPTLKQTTGVKLTSTEKSVKVTWNKVNGAKGYQIYRATSKNGTYKKVITTSKLSFTNKNLTVNKGYYYKVRAYKKVNGKFKYGKFSTVKYIKTKNHSWKPVYKEVDKGHYETRTKNVAYIECYSCGSDITANWESHMGKDNGTGSVCGSYGTEYRTETYKVWVPNIVKEVDYYKCSCGAKRTHPYSKMNFKVKVKPTCERVGFKDATCPVCKKIISITIPKTSHNWDNGYVVSPTCTKGGYTLYTCKTCGKTEKRAKVSAVKHTWKNKYVETEQEVVEPTIYTQCDICEQELSYDDNMDEEKEHALIHMGEDVTYTDVYDYSVEPTIQVVKTLVSRTCTVCGETESHSHNWVTHSKQVVVGSEWGTETVKESWERCTGCGADVTIDPETHFREEHALKGDLNASAKTDYRYVEKPVWIPIYDDVFDYKECSICGYKTTDENE